MGKLYELCINVYRKIMPAGVRHLIGMVRSSPKIWTEAEAIGVKWYYQHYSIPRWQKEYASGRWEYMWGLDELVRYSNIMAYVRYLKPRGSILDLGSGEGILQERLGAESYSRYIGVDISQSAIKKAQVRQDGKTTFICADLVTFVPDCSFDVIVFNEILYYLDDPLSIMKYYARFLEPNGIFIVSMYITEDTIHNWRTLKSAYDFFDEIRSTNKKSGYSWSCAVWGADDNRASRFEDTYRGVKL